MSKGFASSMSAITTFLGRPVALVTSVLLLIAWGASYPLWKSGDTWQLVINTTTTIITYLMVFAIQNTQNRDALAIHAKLDAIVHAMSGAPEKLVGIEGESEAAIEAAREGTK